MMIVEKGDPMANKKYGIFMSVLLLILGYLFSSFMTALFAILGTFIGNVIYGSGIATVVFFIIVNVVFLLMYFQNLRKIP